MNSLLIKFAKLLSYLLHPMLVPTYMLYFILNSKAFLMVPIPEIITKYIYALVICFTILLPLSFALYLKKSGAISSLQMNDREERKIPFFFTIGCYFGVFYVLSKSNVTMLLTIMILGAITSLFLLLILNNYSKISAHAVGISGALGTMFCIHYFLNINMLGYIIVTILLTGIVGSARLILNAHTRKQVYLGYLVGIIGQIATFTYYKYVIFQ